MSEIINTGITPNMSEILITNEETCKSHSPKGITENYKLKCSRPIGHKSQHLAKRGEIVRGIDCVHYTYWDKGGDEIVSLGEKCNNSYPAEAETNCCLIKGHEGDHAYREANTFGIHEYHWGPVKEKEI